MTGDRSLLKNFIKKFMGLGHNLFSVGQLCNGDLEVAFRSKTCYVRNLEGDDMLRRARESNFYTVSISDMVASSPACLMSKSTLTKSWLWHRKLSHLNFGKSKKSSHPPKVASNNHYKLELLHMDLCGPMRVASIDGKKGSFYRVLYPKSANNSLKMKPKAEIGIFIGYSETLRGLRIYNRRTKKIMETIHVKFDELTTMAFERDSLEPILQRFINDDLSAESMNTTSKEDLDNLFGPMYEEYFEKR
uniref:Retroviral polymerase SH3-like domain-containing protein n=1 Tax=Tanacetum cinerariifolium TaxID=118510 RepID=A0A6L2LYD3_TANCI|nr:hypothetical protein [Tanacetum cinerariifolium]